MRGEFFVKFKTSEATYILKLFDTLSQYDPEFRKKVIPIEGDLLEPNLGISSSDEKLLIDDCNIIYHSAATVRFDEPLK